MAGPSQPVCGGVSATRDHEPLATAHHLVELDREHYHVHDGLREESQSATSPRDAQRVSPRTLPDMLAPHHTRTRRTQHAAALEDRRVQFRQILAEVLNVDRDALVHRLEALITADLQVAHCTTLSAATHAHPAHRPSAIAHRTRVVVDAANVLRVHAVAQAAAEHGGELLRQPLERRVDKRCRDRPQEEFERATKDLAPVLGHTASVQMSAR